MAEHRAYWRAEILGLDPRKFVFLDETWTKTNMTRRLDRAIAQLPVRLAKAVNRS
ncbi:MAG: hypothetical protein GWP14_10590 [Actinobacteria bacterium]|nr:hypothetical protein [Actinomycetota bacterium]